jgi:hypothetical protein
MSFAHALRYFPAYVSWMWQNKLYIILYKRELSKEIIFSLKYVLLFSHILYI